MQTSISSKGQITVPKAVREALHLQAGDKLQFFLEPDGTAGLAPVKTSVKELKGMLPRPDQPRTLAQMQAAIEDEAMRS